MLRRLTNRWFISGLIVLAGGSGPLLIGGFLEDLGYIDIGNGLGQGCLFWLAFPIAALALIAGYLDAIDSE